MAGITRYDDPDAAAAVCALGYVQGEHRPTEAQWFASPVLAPWQARTHQLHLTEFGSDLATYNRGKQPLIAAALAGRGVTLRRSNV